MSLISMHGAWLSFSDSPLLDNAELHIEDNERVCLVGRNGAGKSTLMKILNREQGLDDGRIVYEQDLIVSRLQQDPPRHVTGSVYDFVAEGISEQAEYLKRYHEISHLVMTTRATRISMSSQKCRRCSITTACGSLKTALMKCWHSLVWKRIWSCLRSPAAGCVKRPGPRAGQRAESAAAGRTDEPPGYRSH